MDVGDFSKAYVAQQYTNYYLMGNDYDVPEAIAYAECTAVYYNDVQVSFVVVGVVIFYIMCIRCVYFYLLINLNLPLFLSTTPNLDALLRVE